MANRLRAASQATSCSVTFDNGSLRQIRGKITTSLVNLSIAEPPHGGFKVTHSRNRNPLVLVPSYGFMENVSVSHPRISPELHDSCICSGRRKERSLVCRSFHIPHNKFYSTLSGSSSIIQDIRTMATSGLASLAFFYWDFRDDQKKDRHGLLSSLLIQLCDQS